MTAATTCSCRRARCTRCCTAIASTAKRVGFDRRGRPEGEIVDVLERANREVVGRIHEERGVWFVEAENRRINQDLLMPPDERGGAQPGQVVVVEIIEQPSAHREAVARVKEVLGSATDPGIEIEIALRKHDAAVRVERGGAAAGAAPAGRSAARRPQGPHRPHAPAARDDRRRDGEGLRRRRLLRAATAAASG